MTSTSDPNRSTDPRNPNAVDEHHLLTFLGPPDDEDASADERFVRDVLTDEDAWQLALASEDDLFDAYARGELDDDARRRVEATLLAHREGRARLTFARDFDRHTTVHRDHSGARDAFRPEGSAAPGRDEDEDSGWLRRLAHWVFPAGTAGAWRPVLVTALLLSVGIGWLGWRVWTLGQQLDQVTVARQDERENLQVAEERSADLAAEVRRLEEESGALAERTEGTDEDEAVTSDQTVPDQTVIADLRAQLAAAGSQLEELQTRVAEQAARGASSAAASVAETAARTTASFVLTGATRGAHTPRFKVPRQVERVEVEVDLAGLPDLETVRARLQAAGQDVWVEGRLVPERDDLGTALTLDVPARVLEDGDYTLYVESATEGRTGDTVAAFDFRVEREDEAGGDAGDGGGDRD